MLDCRVDVARVGSRGGSAEGQGLPAPICAGLIPHVPTPACARGRPGAIRGDQVSCAVTVYGAYMIWCVVVSCGGRRDSAGGAGQGRRAVGAGQRRAAPMWAGLRPLKHLTSRLPSKKLGLYDFRNPQELDWKRKYGFCRRTPLVYIVLGPSAVCKNERSIYQS